MRRVPRLVAVTAIVLGVLGLGAPVAAAPVITLTPASVTPPVRMTVGGTGWDANGTVHVYRAEEVPETKLAQTTATPGGTFNTTFIVPGGVRKGDHLVIACQADRPPCGPDNLRASATFRVTGDQSSFGGSSTEYFIWGLGSGVALVAFFIWFTKARDKRPHSPPTETS